MPEIIEKLKKYNFWENGAFKKAKIGYKRVAYLKKLKEHSGNSLIKVLMGQRRTGKSYILRQFIKELVHSGVKPKNIFYLNKELIEFDEIQTHKDLEKLIQLYKKVIKPKGKIYILIDEIQEISKWEKLINSLAQNYKEKAEVYITGSNSTMLSSELSTYLSGRYVSFEVLPFSYTEYVGITKQKREKKSYLSYLQSGGLPELFHLNEVEIQANYVKSLRDTILFKDIVQRYNIKDAALLEALFMFLVDNIGNLYSVNAIVQYLNSHNRKTNSETLSNYLQHLTHSFLFHQVQRYNIKGKAILSGAKKYYLNDLAFRNFLTSSFDEGLGKHLENAIYLHFKSRGEKIFVGNIGKQEVDFIVETKTSKQYIQVCYLLSNEKVIEREFSSLEKIPDNYTKKVISLDEAPLGQRNGIEHVPAWQL
jgi:uncharacterized protein